MTPIKPRRSIAPNTVDANFNEVAVGRLARIAKISTSADHNAFAQGIPEAAKTYTSEIAKPSRNAVIGELQRLGSAAHHRRYSVAARALSALSTAGRATLAEACQFFRMTVSIPSPNELSDPHFRDRACANLICLCEMGGGTKAGKLRPSGRRSIAWQPDLRCGEIEVRPSRREAELEFLRNLRLCYLVASGREAPWTAHAAKPGPFARMVQECLQLAGAADCNGVELINTWDERRKEVLKGLSAPKS